jgi:GH35 family endo-1,4-beta-xylanase
LNTLHSQTNNVKNILEEYNYSKDSFFVGGTLNKFQLNTEVENIFLEEFNYLTPANSFKQTVIHPKPDVWRWERYDSFMNFANENNLMLRVHGPISPQASKWVKDDSRTKEELSLILEEFLIELCKKVNVEKSVRWMDVVNETVLRNGTWFAEKPGDDKWENPWTQIGINEDGFPKYIVKAFEIANKHATNIKLVYNHNGGMEKVMWEKIMETITYLKSKGLRVDAIGWQAHLRTNSLSSEDLQYLDFLIDWAHKNNLEFHITELNLWVKEETPNLDSIQTVQAELYKKIMDKMISKKNNGVVALNFWGIKDRKGPSKLNKNILSIYDKSLEPNPALNAVKKSLKSK